MRLISLPSNSRPFVRAGLFPIFLLLMSGLSACDRQSQPNAVQPVRTATSTCNEAYERALSGEQREVEEGLAQVRAALDLCLGADDDVRTKRVSALQKELRYWESLQQLAALVTVHDYTAASEYFEQIKSTLPSGEVTEWQQFITTSRRQHEASDIQRWQQTLPTYARELHPRYASRLRFASADARAVVSSSNIDCSMPNRRRVPLINVLYATLAAMDSEKAWLTYDVDSRAGEVRIYESASGPNGPLSPRIVSMTINEWGELITERVEAVRNTCLGSYGRIWVEN